MLATRFTEILKLCSAKKFRARTIKILRWFSIWFRGLCNRSIRYLCYSAFQADLISRFRDRYFFVFLWPSSSWDSDFLPKSLQDSYFQLEFRAPVFNFRNRCRNWNHLKICIVGLIFVWFDCQSVLWSFGNFEYWFHFCSWVCLFFSQF